MALSDILRMINIMIFLLVIVMISPAKAQTKTCDSSSPQCCWVVRIWQLMGKRTSVLSTSSTGCCFMSGVTCSGSKVITIDWNNRNLTGSIPSDIENLVNLDGL
jgi:hypothetical protein